ncbi:daunorubicin/doxorubicin resistance ABC transporter ATP-binding protein DrrA, partial [Mesorhizobium sp. M00.F.Ca.ET.186.01.1.1]
EISVQKPTLDEVFLTITGHGASENAQQASEQPNRTEAATV